MIRFYPEWPTYIAKEDDAVWTESQIGLVCKDPLEMTGSFLACHSIRFSRFKLRRTTPLSCGFTRRLPLNRSWRRGDTLLISSLPVNSLSEVFSNVFHLGEIRCPGTRNAHRSDSGGVRRSSNRHHLAATAPIYESPPGGTQFSTRVRSPSRSGSAETYSTLRRRRTQQGIPGGSSIPRYLRVLACSLAPERLGRT